MKKTKVLDSVPMFTEQQLEKQMEKQVEFLKAIYPFLEDKFRDGAVELRPIKRESNCKYVRSFKTWHLEEKDVEELKKFLGKINGQGFCLYYSIYAFDYEKDRKGRINNENALFTSILPIDFDNVTDEEFIVEKQKLINIGIETIDVFTGHGFQCIMLLDSKYYDTKLLKRFTNTLISKGFKCDPVIQESARVMRMPYSFNCKALDSKSKYYNAENPEILPTTVINWTDKKYSVEDIFKKLDSMPTVLEIEVEDKNTQLKVEPLVREKMEHKIKKVEEKGTIKIENVQSLYKEFLNIERLEEPIKKMLKGSKDGFRNQVLLFIVPYLRNTLGLNIQTVKAILEVWSRLCIPVLDTDFIYAEVDRLWAYGLKAKHGKYTTKLKEEYGYLELKKYKRDNKITIPNTIFEDFDVICDGAVQIYLSLKLAEKIDGIKEFTSVQCQTYAKISESTFRRNIKDLLRMGYVCKKTCYRKTGEKYIYYINKYFSAIKGFTTIENALIKCMLLDLTSGEMKLYIYLCYMIGANHKECWAGQKYLAKKIDKKQNSIAEMTSKLAIKNYIKKVTTEENGVKHCTYNLNY